MYATNSSLEVPKLPVFCHQPQLHLTIEVVISASGASPLRSIMDVLPLELVELVIDQLSLCCESLRTCSLVSTSWLPRSSNHLFRSLRVSHGRRRLLSIFFDFALSSEHMATNICNLSIVIDRTTAAKAAASLVHLPALRSLHVSAAPDLERYACPDTTSLPGRHIEDLSRSSMPVDLVAHFLSVFSSVGTLAVRHCWQEGPVLRAHRIRRLGITNLDGAALQDVRQLVEPSTLQGIILHFPPEYSSLLPDDVNNFFDAFGGHVRTLHCFIDPLCEEHVPDCPALHACNVLEPFEVSLPFGPAFHDDCWRNMLVALSSLPSQMRTVQLIVARELDQGARETPRTSEWKVVGRGLEHCNMLQIHTLDLNSLQGRRRLSGDRP